MMLSRIVFLVALVQAVAAFAPLHYRTTIGRSSQLNAVEDLEAKVLVEKAKPTAGKARAPVKETNAKASLASATPSDLSLLKSEMPLYEPTTSITTTAKPKAKPEKAKPVPKPKPEPAPKAVRPAPTPKVEKPRPVVVEKPKPKPKPIVVQQVKKPLPPPTKPAAGDFQTIATGVALGGAPLALGALGALAAARGALAGTAARREKIQEQIAAQEAKKQLAAQQEIDFGGVITAGVFLGAAGASLALIILNPFGTGEGAADFNLPFSLPEINLPAGGPSTPAVSEPKPPSASDLARAKIRAEQLARLEEKRAINEAKRAELAKKGPPPRATTLKKTKAAPVAPKEDDSYEALFKKAATTGTKKAVETKEARVVTEIKPVVSAATLVETDAKAALDEAKSLAAPKEAASAIDKAAVEKDAQEAKAKAEAEAVAAAKKLAVDQERAAKAAQEAAETEKKMIAAEKAAIAAKDAEAAKKAAEVEVQAKEAAAVAKAAVKTDAKVEAVAAQKVAETTKASEVSSSSDAPTGGRVLPKEEISAETLALLKSLKK